MQTRTAPVSRSALERFNDAPAEEAVRTLLACLDSRLWAERLVSHRPYPDLPSLLAAADEAAYDLSPADLTGALAAEALPALPRDTYAAAHTALSAATAAYEARFGHAFVICLDGMPADEALDHALAGIRSRLANDPDEERAVAADELRRLARGRLTDVLQRRGAVTSAASPRGPDEPATAHARQTAQTPTSRSGH
ncbi:2-oxo-4-hydroxy-4-carboxy-5-ureidoimidazoline decarboxylase [Streptomyces sp. NPDC087512]|uniref:2-oxo-4-hydroxy-4-carboxy-5-ureidoimidazoline decarboxylase n=1 Tax=Streptomyces sp. NPDC087512 TaxID=3155059 RepID=UPI00343DFB78